MTASVSASIPASLSVRSSLSLDRMRDRDTIDAELRLLAAVRRTIREHAVEPPSRRTTRRAKSRRQLGTKRRGRESRPGGGPLARKAKWDLAATQSAALSVRAFLARLRFRVAPQQ